MEQEKTDTTVIKVVPKNKEEAFFLETMHRFGTQTTSLLLWMAVNPEKADLAVGLKQSAPTNLEVIDSLRQEFKEMRCFEAAALMSYKLVQMEKVKNLL